MKTVFFVSRISGYLTGILFGCMLIFSPHEIIAQEEFTPRDCTSGILGHIDGNVILWKSLTKRNSTTAIDLCKCASKDISKPKKCLDINGRIIVDQGYEPENAENRTAKPSDTDVPTFQLLAGKTNCRLISVYEKVLMISGNTVKVGPECHCISGPDCDCKGKANCNCDCGCKINERWNFEAVDKEDPSQGFYIVTQEREARAVMRNGDGVSLRHLNRMDGKMKELSKWNIFINDRNTHGITQYILRPQNKFDMVLAVNSKDGSLTMVKNNFVMDAKEDAESRSAQKPTTGDPATPFIMMKDWKCECVF